MNILKKLHLLLFVLQLTLPILSNPGAYTPLFKITIPSILYSPESASELQLLIEDANKKDQKICIVGAGKSQGGQTISSVFSTYRISLEKMNKLISLNVKNKEVTIETGMTWNTLQNYISPFGLAVKAMQSYNDFSIGGSLSVNVHGQDLLANPLIDTVKSFKLLQSNGKIIDVSRTKNKQFFSLAIGGYGLFGIITEVTLELTDNSILKRNLQVIDSNDLSSYFLQNIKNNPDIEFYSARFSMNSSYLLEKALVLTYSKTDKFSNESLQPLKGVKNYSTLGKAIILMKKYKTAKNLRFLLEKAIYSLPQTITRNKFMSNPLSDLPKNDDHSYILQEYFIPYKNLNNFIDFLRTIIKENNINILNLTARHVCKNTESMLSYSPQECCALVLYLNINHKDDEYPNIITWTRQLIDKTITLNGTYYLPYHLLGTQEQIRRSYPQFDNFIKLKKLYDPKEMFTNKLYEQYCK
ncbi:MAG: FAD-binding protein [Candidatus Babeliales bacterium]|nr:FAD-binding protein [Candidatus Babeliales bacterium]